MNGGLSLRNRTMMLDIVTEFSFKDELDNLGWTSDPKEKYEDQWFYSKMRGRPDANLPIPDVVKGIGDGKMIMWRRSRSIALRTYWPQRPKVLLSGYHRIDMFSILAAWYPYGCKSLGQMGYTKESRF